MNPYFFFAATLEATACFFFSWTLFALVFFCDVALFVAFGDLSPMVFIF